MRRLVLSAAFAAPALLAQDPTKAYPHNYKLVIDNPDLAVLRVHYGPHEKVGVHDHSAFSTVYVYLNDSGPVRFQHQEEAKPFDLNRPPTHAGAFRVSPGRIERHTVENLSDQPSDFLRIELKRLPVHSLPMEFRGPAPQPPLTPGTTVVYDNPQLRVERVVCAAAAPCTVPAEDRGSVLVRFPAAPQTASQSEQAFANAREARWLAPRENLTVDPDGEASVPIVLLRVSVPRS